MSEECSEHLDTAVRPIFNIIDKEKASVRILGNGSMRRADIRIRSSMHEADLHVVGDGVEPDEVEVEEAGSGIRIPVKMPDPKRPSQEEVDQHDLTHLPFRNWCAHCVRGKGSAADHRHATREDGMPEFHLDYCFMKSHGAEMKTILVCREKESRITFRSVVPLKGASEGFAVRRTLAFLKEVGMEASSVFFRSDQEPAIIDLINEVSRRRQAKSFVEQSSAGSSASNGIAERAVQSGRTCEDHQRCLTSSAPHGDSV